MHHIHIVYSALRQNTTTSFFFVIFQIPFSISGSDNISQDPKIPETPEELQEFIDKTIATLEGVQERLKKRVTQGGKSSR